MGQSSDDEVWDRVVLVLLGCAGVVFGAKWLMDRYSSGALLDMVGGGDRIAALGQRVLTVALIVLGVAVVVRLAMWWRRRRQRIRADRADLMAGELAKLLPSGWSADSGLRVWWKGLAIKRLRIGVRAAAITDQDWRNQMREVVVKYMGPVEPIEWPSVDDKPRLLSRRPPMTIDVVPMAADRASAADDVAASVSEATTVVERAVTGLVPAPRVEVAGAGNADEPWQIVIGYGETTRDMSPMWQSRVVDQVQGRLGTRLRATWDRKARRAMLTSVPALPESVTWSQAYAEAELVLADRNKARVAAGKAPELTIPYGTDEDGRSVAWTAGDRQPHAVVVGGTGSGKTATMISIVCGALRQGALVAISDPMNKDWSPFLGRSGVLAVGTELEDRLLMLQAINQEVDRRRRIAGLQTLVEQHPDLDVPAAAVAAFQPIVLVLDEFTEHNKELGSWWKGLTKDEKRDWGTESTQPPMLGWPMRVARVARKLRIHLLVGMQRADAENFGGDTQMRDLLPHIVTQGELSVVSSRMVYGDLRGCQVEITDEVGGTGLSNGQRLDGAGVVTRPAGTPGRYKAWYAGDDLTPEFWDTLAHPDDATAGIDLEGVSLAARDPRRAAAELLAAVFPGGVPTGVGPNDDGAVGAVGAAIGDTAGITQGGPDRQPVSVPQQPDADEEPETDSDGLTWEAKGVGEIAEGDRVQLGDDDPVEVVGVEGETEDEFSGDLVWRVTVLGASGDEEVVDLSPEEAVYVASRSDSN